MDIGSVLKEFCISLLSSVLLALLLDYFFPKIRKKLHLSLALVVLIVIYVVAIILVIISNNIGVRLLLLLLPLIYPCLQWGIIYRKYRSVRRFANSDNYDIHRYNYYVWLSKIKLFPWEEKYFLYNAMNILFEIGAINELSNQLERLKIYSNWYEWVRLSVYLNHNRREYHEMIRLLKPYAESKRLSPGERLRTLINLHCAYHSLEMKEETDLYRSKIEHMVFAERVHNCEAIDVLMYYFDSIGEEEKIAWLIDFIKKLKYRSLDERCRYYDIIYMHNRRRQKVDENRLLISEQENWMDEYNCDEEHRLIYGLRMLRVRFENDYEWEAYSIDIFKAASIYLTYSKTVAMEYMKAVCYVMENSDYVYHCRMDDDKFIYIYNQIKMEMGTWIPELDKEIYELPSCFTYRKRELYRTKLTYLRGCANIDPNEFDYRVEMCRILKNIIENCRLNGDLREELRQQVVFCDEVFCLKNAIDAGFEFRGEGENIEHLLYEAKNILDDIGVTLKKHQYDKSFAYEILFAAFFQLQLNNMGEAKFLLQKFKDSGANIMQFSLSLQKQYHELINKLK